MSRWTATSGAQLSGGWIACEWHPSRHSIIDEVRSYAAAATQGGVTHVAKAGSGGKLNPSYRFCDGE